MAEWVQGYIKAKGEEIKKRVEGQLNATITEAQENLEAVIDGLVEAAKVSLPVNLLDIMSKGGLVLTKIQEVQEVSNELELRIGHKTTFYPRRPMIGDGIWRFTVICERLGDVKKEDC